MTQESANSSTGPIDLLSTKEGYDRWAEFYDGDGNPLVALEEPWMETLLGNVSGLKVADIGCGTGRHSLRLAAAGAIVQAVDFSEGMLARARAKTGTLSIVFRSHDLATPLPFDDGTFDRVVCGLVIDHIENLDGLFREMHRVCRRLVRRGLRDASRNDVARSSGAIPGPCQWTRNPSGQLLPSTERLHHGRRAGGVHLRAFKRTIGR